MSRGAFPDETGAEECQVGIKQLWSKPGDSLQPFKPEGSGPVSFERPGFKNNHHFIYWITRHRFSYTSLVQAPGLPRVDEMIKTLGISSVSHGELCSGRPR